MSILSIMIDEAGNFDMGKYSNPFYCIILVFHNQAESIKSTIEGFDNLLTARGYDSKRAIHTSPLIRKEYPYQEMEKYERKALFRMTSSFVLRLPIRYKTFIFNKEEPDTYKTFLIKMASEIYSFIREHLDFFQSYDRIEWFYDKGQREVSNLLRSTFEEMFYPNVEMRVSQQNDYKLLQVADFLCTIEYTKKKWDLGIETKSERDFFESRRYFVQNYYNKVKKLQLA